MMSTLAMTEEQHNEMQDELWREGQPFNEAESDREYARAIGAGHPRSAWINSDRDVWYPNPFYRGPKCIASIHPEDSDPDLAFMDLHAECSAHGKCLHGFGAPVYGPVYQPPVVASDDLPF